jgi:hypothetical protein
MDPSPNLFSDPNGGNSHSIRGKSLVLGLEIAALMDEMACLSLFAIVHCENDKTAVMRRERVLLVYRCWDVPSGNRRWNDCATSACSKQTVHELRLQRGVGGSSTFREAKARLW